MTLFRSRSYDLRFSVCRELSSGSWAQSARELSSATLKSYSVGSYDLRFSVCPGLILRQLGTTCTGIIVHHLWVLAYCTGFGRFGLAYSTALFFLSTCSCGLFLALVFGLGHNGMATYDAETRPDFWKLQVTTTRNIIGGHGFPQFFVDWLCGGENRQQITTSLQARHLAPYIDLFVTLLQLASLGELPTLTHERNPPLATRFTHRRPPVPG